MKQQYKISLNICIATFYIFFFNSIALSQNLETKTLSIKQNFKVGIILPLSGPVASMGNAVKDGIDLYLNENDHLKSSIILEDGRYDGKTTISAFHKLTKID
jgi:outer membrane PBP1 activator LpoA protein